MLLKNLTGVTKPGASTASAWVTVSLFWKSVEQVSSTCSNSALSTNSKSLSIVAASPTFISNGSETSDVDWLSHSVFLWSRNDVTSVQVLLQVPQEKVSTQASSLEQVSDSEKIDGEQNIFPEATETTGQSYWLV